MDGKNVLRIVAGLALIAAIGGIAFFAFQAGVYQGSPVTLDAQSGTNLENTMPYYGYGMRFHYPFGFGLGCFGLLIPLLLFFMAMRAFRFIFWGPHWGWRHHHHGHWGRHWEDGVPPMFGEWHKREHGESREEDKKE